MRFIIYGVGAIGGTVAGALARQGTEVVGIARGAQLEAIRRDGLLLRTPTYSEHVRFECAASPSEITFTPADVIMLTMKSQDTANALLDLRAAGVDTQPILCAQNGVANERMALGHFDLWRDEGLLLFRHALLLGPSGSVEPDQIEILFDIAFTECERFFPAVQYVLWGGKSADEAAEAAMMDCAGEA